MNTQKPRALPGTNCPLYRKDVSEVCHTCHWYRSLRVAPPDQPQSDYDHWDCAITLNVLVGRDLGAQMHGATATIESLRNEVARSSAGQLAVALADRAAALRHAGHGQDPKLIDH